MLWGALGAALVLGWDMCLLPSFSTPGCLADPPAFVMGSPQLLVVPDVRELPHEGGPQPSPPCLGPGQ